MFLRGLQHLYVNTETREELFELLEKHVRPGTNHEHLLSINEEHIAAASWIMNYRRKGSQK